MGIAAGLVIGEFATKTVVYEDLGISRGIYIGSIMQESSGYQSSGPGCLRQTSIVQNLLRQSLPTRYFPLG